MDINPKIEHFCTLFDSNFLPIGMTLHQSLMTHAQPFHLWIICMDELVEKHLKKLELSNVTTIPLHLIETQELLKVKSERGREEYCWTITPFTFQAVFRLNPKVERVTYLDADLFFFDKPQILIQELENSDKQILITEHAYDPKYDDSVNSGRFCVQFITCNNHKNSIKVINWWQKKCLEWCFNRVENGKFGDQKYLDSWIKLFPEEVGIVTQTEKTLAPWNVNFISQKCEQKIYPVFYHFHGLRIISPKQVRLYCKYKIGKQGLKLYDSYFKVLSQNIKKINSIGISTPYLSLSTEKWSTIRKFKRLLFQEVQFKFIA